MIRPNDKKPNPAWLLAIILPAMFCFALYEFINSTDGYGTYQISGKEVLERMSPNFWLWVKLGIVGFIISSILVYLNESGAWLGRYMRGSLDLNIVLCLIGLACLILPWVPALTAKTDGGQFLPKPIKHDTTTTSAGTTTGYNHRHRNSHYTDGILPAGCQNSTGYATGIEV